MVVLQRKTNQIELNLDNSASSNNHRARPRLGLGPRPDTQVFLMATSTGGVDDEALQYFRNNFKPKKKKKKRVASRSTKICV